MIAEAEVARERRKSEYDAEKLQWQKNERERKEGLVGSGERTENWLDAEERRIKDSVSSVAESARAEGPKQEQMFVEKVESGDKQTQV